MVLLNSPFKKFLLFLICGCIILSGCVKPVIREEKVSQMGSKEPKALLQRINEINSKSAESFNAQISVDFFTDKKKFNSIGDAVFKKNPRMMKIKITDIVFKSPISILIQDGESLKFYFPADKTIYIDKTKTIKLKNYINLDIDFKILYPLIIGQIPVIPDYTIKQGLIAGESEGKNSGCFYLILENKYIYETISFKNDIPDKILLLQKDTKNKLEIYLEKPFTLSDVLLYKEVRFVLLHSGDRLVYRLKDIKINAPPDLGDDINIISAKGTKIINME